MASKKTQENMRAMKEYQKAAADAEVAANKLEGAMDNVGTSTEAAAVRAGELQTALSEASAAVAINNQQLQDTSLNLREQLDIQEDLVSNTQSQLKARIAILQSEVENKKMTDEQRENHDKILKGLIKEEKTLRLTRRYYNQIDSSTQGIAGNIGLSYKWETSLLKSLFETNKTTGNVESGWKRMGTNLKGLLHPSELVYTFALKLWETTIAYNKELFEASITLNKSVAMSARFSDNMAKAAKSIYAVGGTLGDASSNIATLVEGFSDFTQITDEGMITSLIKTSSQLNAIGVSTEDFAASLQYLTRNMGYSKEGAIDLNKDLAMFAESIGMAPSKFTKEFALNMPKLEVYGNRAVDVFKRLEKQSKASGVGVDELMSATAKMDTFEGAAEAAGQLNAALGGAYFDSLELLNATEDERLDIIKNTINSTGIQFDQLGKFEKRLLAQAAGFEDVAKFERLLNGETDSLNKQQREFGEVMADSTTIMDSLKAIFMTLIPTISPLIKSFSQWIAGIAASEEKTKLFIDILKGMIAGPFAMVIYSFKIGVAVIKTLASWFTTLRTAVKPVIEISLTAADTMGGLTKSITPVAQAVAGASEKVGFFTKMFGKISPVVMKLFAPLKFFLKFLGPLNFVIAAFETLVTVFDDIAANGFTWLTPIKAVVELLLNMFVNPFISLLNLIPGIKIPKLSVFGGGEPKKHAT